MSRGKTPTLPSECHAITTSTSGHASIGSWRIISSGNITISKHGEIRSISIFIGDASTYLSLNRIICEPSSAWRKCQTGTSLEPLARIYPSPVHLNTRVRIPVFITMPENRAICLAKEASLFVIPESGTLSLNQRFVKMASLIGKVIDGWKVKGVVKSLPHEVILKGEFFIVHFKCSVFYDE